MSDWTDLGFPLPRLEGYGISRNAGLWRTPFDSARPRQAAGAKAARSEYQVSAVIPCSQVTAMEAFFNGPAYTWFSMPLVSGAAEGVSDHTVRAIGELTLTPLSAGPGARWEASFAAESRIVADAPDLTAPGYSCEETTCCDADDYQCCSAGCVPVDFSGWVVNRYAYGNASLVWGVEDDGLTAYNSYSGGVFGAGSATELLVGTIETGNLWAFVTLMCTDSADDDAIGFALGYEPGDTDNPAADFLVWAWKQAQDQPGWTRGSHLQRFAGIPGWAQAMSSDGAVSELQRGAAKGSSGWVRNQEYQIEIRADAGRVRIWVDGVLDIDYSGDIPAGRLAMYSCSQKSVYYSASICDPTDSGR